MDAIELREVNCEQIGDEATIIDRQDSYFNVEPSSSMITLHEQNPFAHWEPPSIISKEVYKMKWYKYFATTQIKVSNINISFACQNEAIHIGLIDKPKLIRPKSMDTNMLI